MVLTLNIDPPDYTEDSSSEEELDIIKDPILSDQVIYSYAG